MCLSFTRFFLEIHTTANINFFFFFCVDKSIKNIINLQFKNYQGYIIHLLNLLHVLVQVSYKTNDPIIKLNKKRIYRIIGKSLKLFEWLHSNNCPDFLINSSKSFFCCLYLSIQLACLLAFASLKLISNILRDMKRFHVSSVLRTHSIFWQNELL